MGAPHRRIRGEYHDDPNHARAARRRRRNSGRPVAGRLTVDGHGYITVETLDGAPDSTTYTSPAGEVVTFAIDFYWFPYHYDVWAVTRALGETPGEVLYSTDSGLSWSVVGGHGLTDPTGIVLQYRYQQQAVVYLAGEDRVVRSLDGGATWAPFMDGLPAGGVNALQLMGQYVAVLPNKDEVASHNWMLAATDGELYQFRESTQAWELILAEDCARIESSVMASRAARDWP